MSKHSSSTAPRASLTALVVQVTTVVTLLAPAALEAQPPPAGHLPPGAHLSSGDSLPQDTASRRRDPCTPDELQQSWLDWLQRNVSRTVCGSALWFDGLFGDSYVYDERDVTYGRIFVGLWWDERDRLDPNFRFRVKLSFPRLENRANVTLGRENFDSYVSDQADSFEGVPQTLATTDEDEFFLGVGFTPLRGRRSRLSISPGVNLKVPLEPYLKVSYRLNLIETDRTLARIRETGFWRERDGFGTTTRIDLDQRLRQRFLFRYHAMGTFSESTYGLDWQTGITLYQHLGGSRALAYLAEIFGETGRDVPLEDYGLRVVYRQGAFRPWLILELSAGLSWPRRSLAEARKINPGLGFGFEMQYGRYHTQPRF
ncbi:MAG: hypothetical protein JSU87_04470 [Gemmatimonadota bacterium]|nr:MAG: hypothetical protein JSU87_04470 [Gemmatimonadota bacterium]